MSLSKIMKKDCSILEFGTCSGEHGVTFEKRFPKIILFKQVIQIYGIEKVSLLGLIMKI